MDGAGVIGRFRIVRTGVLAAFFGVLLAAWFLPTTAAFARGDEAAELRIAHLFPNVPKADVYLDGRQVEPLAGLPSGSVSEYFPIPSGSHEVQIFAAGDSPDASEPFLNADTYFEAGQPYTLAAIGPPDDSRSVAELYKDDDTSPAEGEAGLRVVHAAPETGPATVNAGDGKDPLLLLAGFGNASSRAELSVGSHDLEVTPAGSDEAILTVPNVELADGEVRTFFIVRLEENGPLEAIPAVDRDGDARDAVPPEPKRGKPDPPSGRPNTQTGTAAADLLKGTQEADVLSGKGNDDALRGRGGSDRLSGGGGDDGLYGGPGDDDIRGNSGEDRAKEGLVAGGPGADTIRDGAGEDGLYAGAGDDTVFPTADREGDLLDCGPGTDTVKGGTDPELDRFVDCEKLPE